MDGRSQQRWCDVVLLKRVIRFVRKRWSFAGGRRDFRLLNQLHGVVPDEVDQRDQQMLEYDTISLKQNRSPPRSSTSTSSKSTSASADQVSSSIPCMLGDRGGKAKIEGTLSLESKVIPSDGFTRVMGKTGDKRKDSRRVGVKPVDGREGVVKAGGSGEEKEGVKAAVSGVGGVSISIKAPGVLGVSGVARISGVSGRVLTGERVYGVSGGLRVVGVSRRGMAGGRASWVVGGSEVTRSSGMSRRVRSGERESVGHKGEGGIGDSWELPQGGRDGVLNPSTMDGNIVKGLVGV